MQSVFDTKKAFKMEKQGIKMITDKKYTQSPLIRTTAKLPTLGVLKNSSNLDAHWFLIPQVWALAGS